MFWDQKASAIQNEHYQLIPEKKRVVVDSDQSKPNICFKAK